MNWLDWVVIALLAFTAAHGWRRGAVIQVLAFGGFWGGLLLGAIIAPPVSRLTSGLARSFVAILVVLFVAALGGGIGELVGLRLARVVRRVHLGTVDKSLGVLVALAGTVLALWLLSSLISASRFSTLGKAIQGSTTLRTIDQALPTVPSVFAQVESFLVEQGFPVVFVNFPPGVLPEAPLPSLAAQRPAIVAAARSTVKIIGPACGAIVEGSGFVVAPGLVVTNAHVVAGDRSPEVIDANGAQLATPVLFDPRLDIAVLEVRGLAGPALSIDPSTAPRGATAVALGYPEGGGLTATPAAVNGSFPATGLDIYGTAVVTRSVYELNAAVLPGNSGGPLVSTGSAGVAPGTVIGVIFARSTTNTHLGYALSMDPVERDIARAESSLQPVSTGACAP